MSAEVQINLSAFFISLFVSGAIYWLARKRNQTGFDDIAGPQKIHQGTVPRIGSIAIVVGLFVSLAFIPNVSTSLFVLLIIAAMPVFVAGIAEDLTGSVSAKLRLVASLISGCLFCWITGYQITSVGIESLSPVLAMPFLSFVLTSVAVGAMVNALNIIDGLNGLASTTTVFMIASFGALSARFGDSELQVICFLIVSVNLGFLIWNFPFGKLFLGDGGAYFLGAMAAGIAVVLPERNDEISPFSSMLIIIYPFYELVRSTTRRIVAKGYQALEPDDKHLHSMIYKLISSRVSMTKPFQNSFAAVLVLILPMLCCFWAVTFANERSFLISGIFAFILLYEMSMMLVVNSNNA